MSGLFRLIVALPGALAGLIISEFAGDISSRIISRLIDKLKSFISNRGQMVLARALEIEHSDDDNKWMWVPQQNSRFKEVVGLLKVHWLEIQAMISFLSGQHKTTQNSTCLDTLQEASVSVGNLQLKKDVCIKPRVPNPRNKCNAFPVNRSDGWMDGAGARAILL
ncbi:putative F-box protein PP2-B12 [Carex rostrata]